MNSDVITVHYIAFFKMYGFYSNVNLIKIHGKTE